MPSAFDNMMAAGAAMLDGHFGEPVTIARGSNTTARVSASWVAQTGEAVTADTTHTAIVDRFWFIAMADYVIADATVEPRTGDRLTDDKGHVWEILPAKTRLPVIDYADGNHWKIATKQVT